MSQALESADRYTRGSPSHPPPANAEKSRKASSACLACKQRKTRCSGDSPCTACASRLTQCLYDVAADQRRKIANQRNIEELARRGDELHRQQLLLGGMLAIMRSGDGNLLAGLSSAIRNHAGLTDLASFVERVMAVRHDLREGYQPVSFDLTETTGEGPTSPTVVASWVTGRDDRLSSHYILNTPITLARGPWTTLANSEMVSHLMSLFFTWEYPLFQCFDKSAFLLAFKSGDTSSKFCSKLLVHAILAQACLVSGRSESKALQDKCFGEAKLYLELEAGRASITTLQALLVMYQYEGNRGRDRIGRTYRYQAVDIYRRLGFNRRQSRPTASTDDEWRAITKTIWGTFVVDSLLCFLYGFSPTIKPPIVERDFPDVAREDLDDRVGMWNPYPMMRPEKQGYLSLSFHAFCDLAIFFSDINQLNETSEGQGLSHEVLNKRVEIYRRLGVWHANLHPKLSVVGEETLPHIYYLEIFTQMAYMILFRPIAEYTQFQMPSDVGEVRAQLIYHAKVSIEIMWKVRTIFTFQHPTTASLTCPIIVAYTLVAHLNTSPDVHEHFTRACQALSEHSVNLPVAHFLLAGLVLLGSKYDVTFTDEDREYLLAPNFSPNALRNVPIDMPILLEIGDNEGERGQIPFDSFGDFLTQLSGSSLQRTISNASGGS